MTGRKTSFYWRFCWAFLTPATMIFVFIYSTVTLESFTYAGLEYPREYIVAGWSIFLIGAIQFPLWGIWILSRNYKTTLWRAISDTFAPSKSWGPAREVDRIEWRKYKEEAKQKQNAAILAANHSYLKRKLYLLFGKY